MPARVPELTCDILVEDEGWSRKRVALQPLCDETLGAAWRTIKGRSRTRPYVSVTFTGDRAIRRINRKFRAKDKATNVLSFQTFAHHRDFPAKPAPLPVGDIVLAVETIEREARQKRIAFRAHLTHLLVHGFLHLCGYDHMDDGDADKMENLEIRILQSLGVKNPYAGAVIFAMD